MIFLVTKASEDASKYYSITVTDHMDFYNLSNQYDGCDIHIHYQTFARDGMKFHGIITIVDHWEG